MDKVLLDKIGSKKAKIGIVGLGYVGLPLAVEFCKAGFCVVGIEQNPKRREMLDRGQNYISDVSSKDLLKAVRNKKIKITDDFFELKAVDAIIICVPTPLDKNKQPDISYVKSVTFHISKTLKKGQLVVLESTTYPGTTEEVVLPKLEKSGLKVGKDFYLAFSPERVDPGNKKFRTQNITKVIGGVTPVCSELTRKLYSQIIKETYLVSTPRVAEMEKLLENIFRSVNIALVNELAILCKKMDIDIWEVIDAAKTKPYGFMPFYPGPGLGGHCIPLDPFYLSWKAKEYHMNTRFIELAGELNDQMPYYVVQLVQDGLNQDKKSLKNSKILVLGVAYKKDIDDYRESPSLKIIEILDKKGAKVDYNDPFIPKIKICGKDYSSLKLDGKTISDYDCVVIATAHSSYDYKLILNKAVLIVDTRNAMSCVSKKSGANIIKL
ncbi:UDP-N-acetyl-D-glucosamine dehydrogenase [candidate division WOR-1 bacterium RIFOXYA2_FULL_36_21]|uniref:UDP-N-acetyl-D-glucosamine dehydrogenase n=1 Tax=candidate division WOR-1 bacterium RIFOXYB2_FULL_36_35 TaxID=1802578 RepID=A0A1F4S8D7_UNCSA|nr:MAG: UDP-N-acetyl-D-glucosamine dehydrogenase [candidate division WOR-1 bacterium RIFOXYA2_FULL_36_21]OGC15332.1 MAG: UDP-N-acetyl-D-glucosamine dehydrogenase [candidate division WOR-1 bacterium RIFOXYA12_FULL_36_13]OGC16674.1 MAG: UDP-N-acetyl-D-glucosamine dehydrogenase [candidate division WOR-1 bacterium RIFOXYB2_FULL_36_35]